MSIKLYSTILADPPWKYGNGWGWGAGKYYPLMSIKEICDFSVPAALNAHLYLWCPNGMLQAGLNVMNAWGFTHKTTLTWVKNRSIFGYYFKGQTEQLLFGVKGTLSPQDRKQTTVIKGKIRKHSQKPDEQYDVIEAVSPPPYLELFARQTRRKWDSMGNQLPAAPNFEKG